GGLAEVAPWLCGRVDRALVDLPATLVFGVAIDRCLVFGSRRGVCCSKVLTHTRRSRGCVFRVFRGYLALEFFAVEGIRVEATATLAIVNGTQLGDQAIAYFALL